MSNAIATQETYNPYASYGESAAQNSSPFLKFAKGDWTLGQSEEPVKDGSQFVANMAGLKVGWQRWENNAPAETIMTLVETGEAPPKRSELGFLDKADWEIDEKSGAARDPWQFTNQLPMTSTATGDVMFTTSSRGGINAIGALCKDYGKEYRQRPGEAPVIEIGTESYKHTTYGKVYTPKLRLVGWVDEADLLKSPAGAEPDEEEEKPKVKPLAKVAGRTRF